MSNKNLANALRFLAIDAVEKAKYLLLNPKKTEQIGKKAKQKTYNQHSLEIRWNSFIQYLNSNFF
jgi:spore maturation protein CgeB